MIRVLQVFAGLERGGAETLCMNIYRNIDREIVQFDFVKHTEKKGAYDDEIKKLGGKVYVAPAYKFVNHTMYVKWWRLFLEQHPEYKIVHGHYYTISSIYLSEAQRIGRYAIAHAHCNRNEKPFRLLKNIITRQVKNNCDEAFACSHLAGNWLFGEGNYKVLNNAIDVDGFKYNSDDRQKVRAEFGIHDELLVGTIGRFFAPKNPRGIVKIAQELHKIEPGANLLWVGDGLMLEDMKELVRKKGLDDVVIFAGSRADVPALLSAMDVFILPSNFEGLGIVLIEAQANGLPCIASDVVPNEVNVTGNVEFLSLSDYSAWAKDITRVEKKERYDEADRLKDAKYDITDSANWIQQFYLEIIQETDD